MSSEKDKKSMRHSDSSEGGGKALKGPKINNSKLASELKSKPKDFTKIQNIIVAIKEGRTKQSLALNNNIFRYPLFASNLDGTSLAIFASIIQIGYKKKIEFLQEVIAENIHSHLKEKRDLWIKYFCTTLRMEHFFPNSDSQEIIKLRGELDKEEKRFIDILKKKEPALQKEYKDIWAQEGLAAEAIFVNQSIAFEKPEINIPLIDEFVCYSDSIFFEDFIRNITTAETKMSFALWISARSDLLSDSSTETYKLFCYIFRLGEQGLFEEDGTISSESLERIPDYFHDSLNTVERKRKDIISRQKSEQERRMTEENTRKRVNDLLSQKIMGVCDENFVVTFDSIPPEISVIEINISRNSRAHARAVVRPPFGANIDLKECLFESFNPQKNEQSWNTIADWKGGENYKISLQGKIGTQKTPENELYQWKEKKIEPVKKEPLVTPVLVTPDKSVSQLVSAVSASMTTITIPEPISAAPQATETPKDPKESEKEDLQTALDFFLDKSDQELMSFFKEHTQWNADTQTLTLHIPIEELEEMGYAPSLLSVSEYGPIIQWSVRREKGKWVPEGDRAPEKIQPYYENIFRALSEQIERGEIDNYLSSIGLSPSETSDNSALKGAIRIQENIDIKKLGAGIKKMSEKYIQDGAHYNIYSGPLAKDSTPTSISWFSKKQWRATLTLQPEIKIDLSPTNNQALPYNTALLGQRIENALLNFIYQYIKNEKGISGVIKRTSAQENTKKLRESYRRELKKKTARLLVENADGTFTIIEGISIEGLTDGIANAQRQYGKENVALLYRRNTYTFLGDTSICKPSQSRSDDDYISLNLAERRNIIRERVLKSLFNGKSGIQDRAPFLHNSAVYHALQFEAKALQEQNGRNITKEDITDEFLEKFITILRSGQILISYRDYCAGEVEDLTDLVGE